jgi:hypothetical protein
MIMVRRVLFIVAFFTALVVSVSLVHSSSPIPTSKTGRYASNLQYTGGEGVDYILEQVRWGDHRSFERVVFEFSSPEPEDSGTLPRMKLEIEFYPLRVAIRLPGSDLRRERIFTSVEPFRKSKMISRAETFDVCGGGQHMALIPARPVEFDVFTLTSPPRLVVDMILSRMDPMREQKKLSLRTFPLYGDQVCYLLDEAAEAGITPRLLTDSAGNVFGELGLYDDPDEAFRTLERLDKSLGRNFALKIRARGMMEIPAVLP